MKIEVEKCPTCDMEIIKTIDAEGKEHVLDNGVPVFDIIAGPGKKDDKVVLPLSQAAIGLAYIEHSVVCGSEVGDEANEKLLDLEAEDEVIDD